MRGTVDSVKFELPQPIVDLIDQVSTYVSQPWFIYQVLIIGSSYVAAHLLAKFVEKRLERRVREIKGHPHLLRHLVVILRRTNWVLYVVLLGGVLVLMRNLTWPSRSYLIYVALLLALAWLVLAVVSRAIHSRTISQVVAVSIWIYVAVSIFDLNQTLADFLDGLAFSVGEMRISALLILKAVVLMSISLWVATSIGNYLDGRLHRAEELTPSLRVLIGKVLKFLLVLLAAVVVLSALGIDLTAFAVFSGAVGVGVGFGLRAVVSNFICGIIILLDRSIKPGDTISLDETFGWIRELRARFVSVVTRDGREYLIPNEDFITREVINWSFSDQMVRLDVNFGVSYEADPHQVTALAIEAAASVDRVVPSKAPVCWMTDFGESSLDFVLRFWISDPQNGLTNIRGKVLLAMWDTFKAHGIAIPYPHREIIMRTPVRLSGTAADPPDPE
ncbi:MAG: mechanosensitive ion channel [Gammaproteobacteria bacterium]|nr:mechanosensitive ion channel [Gammaproteobacteria bacterium]